MIRFYQYLKQVFTFIFFVLLVHTAFASGNNTGTGYSPGTAGENYKGKQPQDKEYRISGSVKDSKTGEPMVGVNVYLKETLTGSVTDNSGKYTLLAVAGNYTLVFSFVGYGTQEMSVEINKDMEINVSLKPETKGIDEVRITSQRRFFGDMDVGRTIESINIKEIEQVSVNNAADILHARVSGVWSTKVSGAPGDHQKIRIRGINSLFGSVDPLYVVDGVPVPNVNLSSLGIADLNIRDIENVTVLKDASSTALYGYQGGNGVVLIETKSGGDNKIEFSTTFGIQRFTNFYDLMDTRDFLSAIDSAGKILGTSFRRYYPEYSDTICNTDWQDEIFRDGIVSEYQLSATGRLKKTRYYFSGSYNNQEGVIANSSYKRYTFSTKLSRSLGKKVTSEVLYRGSLQENRNNLDSYGGNAIIFQGINKSPCYNCTPDSMYYEDYNQEYGEALRIHYDYPELNKKQDIGRVIGNNSKQLDIKSHTAGLFAKYLPADNLIVNISATLSFRNYFYSADDYLYVSSVAPGSGYYFKSEENYVILNRQINANWNKSFKEHQLKMIAGYRNYTDNVHWDIDSMNMGSLTDYYDAIFTRGSMAIHGESGSVIRRINSIIGHINYSYRDKYFISAVANYDHLKEGRHVNVKDLFPSVALNWDISKDFHLDRIKWLDYLNIYWNWGETGNYPLNGLSNDMYTETGYYIGDTLLPGYIIEQLANHKMKHEKIEEHNIGFEVSLFRERIIFNADYYIKTNDNLVMLRDIPFYYGGGKMFINAGKTENKGVEYNLELFPVLTSDFSIYTRFLYSSNNQEIIRLSDRENLLFREEDILVPDFVISTDERLGSINTYKNLGKWTAADEQSGDPFIIRKGNMKYLKVDTSTTTMTDDDRIVTGNSLPDFICNWYTSIRYKSFSVDFTLYGVKGVDKYNATRAGTYITGTNREINGLINDTLKVLGHRVFYESSAFIEDAGFIRLKQVVFTWAPEKKIYNLAQMKLSLSFDNLLTYTRYKGYDPEATIYTDNNFSDNAIDRGAYPSPKAVYATIQLRF